MIVTPTAAAVGFFFRPAPPRNEDSSPSTIHKDSDGFDGSPPFPFTWLEVEQEDDAYLGNSRREIVNIS